MCRALSLFSDILTLSSFAGSGRYVWSQCDRQGNSISDLDAGESDLTGPDEDKLEALSRNVANIPVQARDRTVAFDEDDCRVHDDVLESKHKRFSVSSIKTTLSEHSDRTITPETIEYGTTHFLSFNRSAEALTCPHSFHILPEPAEPESPLDPYLVSNAFTATTVQHSTKSPSPNTAPTRPSPLGPGPCTGATPVHVLLDAFPMPSKRRASHCVQLVDRKRVPPVQKTSLHHIPPRRSRLFIRPTSQGSC